MHFGYEWLRKPAVGYAQRILLGIGLIAASLAMSLENGATLNPPKLARPAVPRTSHLKAEKVETVETDKRTVRLQKFFARLHCPVKDLAADFIKAADRNHLDWRLLPSISVVESGGGKAYRNNNIFGWNNGDQPFDSIQESIHLVANRLGRSPLYRNRDLEGKLRVYNPDEAYAETVKAVMNRIGPAPENVSND